MNKILKQMLNQRRGANVKQAQEKVLDIISPEENAN